MVQFASSEYNENSEAENYENDSDGETPTAKHTALLEAVSQLDGKQRIRAPTRSEPSLQVSEFHLVGSGSSSKSKIHVTDLAKVLGKRSSHVEIGRKVQSVHKKSKTLPKPLEKNVSEKVRRSVGFENVKEELGKWEAVVHKNRSVDTINFPLNQPDNRPVSSSAFITKLKSQKPTELEAKVAAILSESSCVQDDDKEEDKEYPLSLEEMLEHRKEMAKMRALQSYKAAKAARQKKIKSKKYHRLQRREGVRKQIKNFELLKKTDPEAALKQLEELERARVEERMTLCHRSTGHWARNKVVRAKYDKEARRALAEQLAISRELTQKVGQDVDSGLESETEAPEAEANTNSSNTENPWIVKTEAEINQFVSGYRKFWAEQNKRKAETEFAEDSSASKEMHENVDSINYSKRIKLMESVVERVEVLECNPVVQSAGQFSKNTAELNVGEIMVEKDVKDSNKVKSNKFINRDKIGQEKINENLVPNKTLRQINKLKDLHVESKKQKSNFFVKEKSKQTTHVTDEYIISTSSWVVTDVNASGCESHFKGKTKGNKIKQSKKSNEILSRPINYSESKIAKQLEMDADTKIDDLFDEAEEKLKQKIKEKVNTLQSRLKEGAKHVEEPSDDISGYEVNMNEPSLKMNKSITRPVVDDELGEVPHGSNNQAEASQSNVDELVVLSQSGRNPLVQHNKVPSAISIDPNNFLQVKQKHLLSQLPDIATKGDEAMDDDAEEGGEDGDEGEQEKLIAEAFADDDVVAEFRGEKKDLIENSKPKDIDLTLPGWGNWGGPNIEVSKRKKRRFIIKVPKDAPRRDDNKGNLIINEDKDTKIKQHQVSELPFPFERVQDFEASIRAPVGRDWVPETAHRKMVLPAVRTQLGTIIEPMDEDVLFSKKKKRGKKKYFPI